MFTGDNSTSGYGKRNSSSGWATFGKPDGVSVTDTPINDKPFARIKPEAEANYNRNRGGDMARILDNDGNKGYSTAMPARRCPSAASQQCYERNRGVMGQVMNIEGNREYVSPRPASRLGGREETQENADRARGCVGSSVLGGDISYRMPKYKDPNEPAAARVVKPEARDIAENNKGNAMKNLFVNYNNQEPSNRPAPRVKAEAQEVADRNKGKVNKLFAQELPSSGRPAPRVKSEALDNSVQGKGTVGQLIGASGPAAGTQSGNNENYQTRNKTTIVF